MNEKPISKSNNKSMAGNVLKVTRDLSIVKDGWLDIFC